MNKVLWKIPPVIKVYEALGATFDGRIRELEKGVAKVNSSDESKTYTVTYDPKENAIMSNDNGSYWQGYLGYPAISYLMHIDILPYDQKHAGALSGIPWKKWNSKNRNDWDKTLIQVNEHLESKGVDPKEVAKAAAETIKQIEKLKLTKLGPRTKPPSS